MYQCNNCSANIKFDIASQMMLCDYCGATMDPYEVEEKNDALESVVADDEYEVTIFSCPQCGGELLCYDDTAATFCSYCGGSTILTSRISREKRPQHIIPFQKTKEQCREAYGKMMKKSFFVPKEMKEEEQIDRFRSIYMPYWVYSYERKGKVHFKGWKSEESNKNKKIVYKKCYNIESEVEAEYKGITFDASSAFSDSLSNAIAPFGWWGAKPFTPAYLSGFYADTADVGSGLYEAEARDIARSDMCKRMREDPVCREYEIDDLLERVMLGTPAKIEMAMLPVWFLSFRWKERVSYAVVNGQTGEVAADLPIDKGQFLKWSGLMTIPVALLMMALLKVSASTFLLLTLALAVISCIISCSQKREIRAKENFQDDRGRWYPVTPGKVWKVSFHFGDDIAFLGVAFLFFLLVLGIVVCFGQLALIGNEDGLMEMSYQLSKDWGWAAMLMLLPLVYKLLPKGLIRSKNTANLTWGDLLDTLKKTGIGILLSLVVLICHPTGELPYYLASLMTMTMTVMDFMDIIERHNILVTRDIPQFRKRGGEEEGR